MTDLEKAAKDLKGVNVHVATRIMSKDLILYREPKPRYKRDGTPYRVTVQPWADLNKQQAKALAFMLLRGIEHDLAGQLYSESEVSA